MLRLRNFFIGILVTLLLISCSTKNIESFYSIDGIPHGKLPANITPVSYKLDLKTERINMCSALNDKKLKEFDEVLRQRYS